MSDHADFVTRRERLRRAEKALSDDLPASNPLWKPWAMDLADDVNALEAELASVLRTNARITVECANRMKEYEDRIDRLDGRSDA